MNKKLLVTGTILALTGIILGAFGAHGLKKLISENAVASFETGVRYQIYHGFLLLFLGISTHLSLKAKQCIYVLTILGVLLFSGSIYSLATNTLTAFNFKHIAFITPVGGLCLIVAWVILLYQFLILKKA